MSVEVVQVSDAPGFLPLKEGDLRQTELSGGIILSGLGTAWTLLVELEEVVWVFLLLL